MELQKITNIIAVIILFLLGIYIYNENVNYGKIVTNANANLTIKVSLDSLQTEVFDKVPNITNEKLHSSLCQNLLFQPNAEILLKENNCNIEKEMKTINNVKKGIDVEDLNTIITWGGRSHLLNVWISRVNTMIDKKYSEERILDLLTIMTMECNKYNGSCDNGNDIGPLQINQIHDNPSRGKMWHTESKVFFNKGDWSGLFNYQLDKATILLDSYDADLCRDEYIVKYGIGATFAKKKWRCVAFMYNGHPKNKFAYNTLGWAKREVIKKYLFDNGIFNK